MIIIQTNFIKRGVFFEGITFTYYFFELLNFYLERTCRCPLSDTSPGLMH